MAPVMPAIGRLMLRAITKARTPPRTSAKPTRATCRRWALVMAASIAAFLCLILVMIMSRRVPPECSMDSTCGLISVSNAVFAALTATS